MVYRTRINYTAAQKADIWDRWQRGEGLTAIGRVFDRPSSLSVHSQAKLNAVARQLNERPRKTLGFETPAERFNACVASIG